MHMANSIFFKEWKGSSGRTKGLLTTTLALLILSTMIVGYGNSLGGAAAH